MSACLLTVTAVLAVTPAVSADKVPAGKKDYAIVIHGGTLGMTPNKTQRFRKTEVLRQALALGTKMLDEGRTSLETVEAVIRHLEDAPDLNAGQGAVFNAAGHHELDASIMDGRTRACGAVGGVRTIKNPISLARLVMTQTRHVLLVTDGAEAFADGFDSSDGIERVPNSYFSTDLQRNRLKSAQEKEKAGLKIDSRGTVGCVALDRNGNLAAGTSTGGLTNKKFGRIGDSPIISAGTYADNRTCGVSCTGTGEDFIRHAVAYDISARMRLLNQPLETAVHTVLHDPEQLVRGGVIAVSRTGQITTQFNTPGMSRALGDSTGYRSVQVGR